MRAHLLLVPAVIVLGCGPDTARGAEAEPVRESAEVSGAPRESFQAARTGPPRTSRRPASPARFVLRLDTRSGDSAMGLSLSSLTAVPRAEADLYLHAWDCGARGRWVELRSAKAVDLCWRPRSDDVNVVSTHAEACGWTSSMEAGGTTRGSFETFEGVSALVRNGDGALTRLRVSRTTTLEKDWYLASPIAPYEVEVELAP